MSGAERRDAPLLRTDRLTLRPPVADDAEAIGAALGDYEVARMLARVPQPYHIQDARDWLARIRHGNGDSRHFAITAGGPLLGVIGLERRDEGLHIGYWLAREHWARGIMSEALEAVLHWQFARSPAETIHSGVFADNAASLRIQAKLGFRVVGRSELFSVGRNAMVSHVDTEVTGSDFGRRPQSRSSQTGRWSEPSAA